MSVHTRRIWAEPSIVLGSGCPAGCDSDRPALDHTVLKPSVPSPPSQLQWCTWIYSSCWHEPWGLLGVPAQVWETDAWYGAGWPCTFPNNLVEFSCDGITSLCFGISDVPVAVVSATLQGMVLAAIPLRLMSVVVFFPSGSRKENPRWREEAEQEERQRPGLPKLM